MKPDPAIDKIREVRQKISAEFGHDPRKLMNYYGKVEKKLHADGKHLFFESPESELEQALLNDKPESC